MSTNRTVAAALSALGHEARLSIFRLLVKSGRDGLNVGEIGEHLGLAPSTLAFHLRGLVAGGLIIQDRRGREVVNRVDFDAMDRTLSFLTAECCAGVRPATAKAG